jgi:hypothetical protein
MALLLFGMLHFFDSTEDTIFNKEWMPGFIPILEFNRVLITVHSTKVYSNITNDKMYDQIAFLPFIKSKIQEHGVFDYDTKIFSDLWNSMSPLDFRAYL